ncbi:MAG TPA: MFS transporter [Opitutus sp.]|nr:MFS transporter [Opitutus sp.]
MSPSARAAAFLLPIIYLGYISLGLPDGTLGVAWPRMHQSLQLPIGLAGVLLLLVTLLAAVSGFNSGRIIARFRTGPVVLVSCVLTGSALLGLGLATNLFWLVVAALPLGFGAGAVDAGLNGYVARHYSGRHMNWLHACWGIGATCGPLIMARALDSSGGWRGGYMLLGSVQLSLAGLFFLTLRLWNAVPERKIAASVEHQTGPAPTTVANSPAGWLSAAILAIYVAIEGTTGLWASSILVESRGVAAPIAGLCGAAYYGAITVGRISSGFVVDRWGNRRLVTGGALTAIVGALLFAFAPSTPVAAVALVITGLGFAPVYPGLMHEVPRRFAPESVQTVIGRQSGAAYIGGAFLPAAAGSLAAFSLEAICGLIAAGAVLLFATIRRLDRIT